MNLVPGIIALIGISLLSSIAHAQSPIIRHVSTTGNDHENLCSSPSSPCRTVGRAVNVAASGDSIQIASGIYTETLSINKSLIIAGEDRTSTYIQAHELAGMADDSVISLAGGAGVEVTIADLTIRHGRATGAPQLGNLPPISGGGLFNEGVMLTLARVDFTANWALLGGGLFNLEGPSTLTDVRFAGNHAILGGGGMINFATNSQIMSNVLFSGNSTAGQGGGLANFDSSPTMTNVQFRGNAAEFGGGMTNNSSHPTLVNVLFSSNHAVRRGGGMENNWSSPGLINVTFNGNSALEGGAVANESSEPELVNVVIWNNRADETLPAWSGSIDNIGTESPTISYSLIAHSGGSGSWDANLGINGGNNLDISPMFVAALDPATAILVLNGNQRLAPDSPAIDSGTNAPFEPGGLASAVTTDLDGNPRIHGSSVDLGAYEYQPPDPLFFDRFEQ